MDTISIINKLYNENNASREELLYLLDNIDSKSKELLIEKAHKTRLKYFKNKVYIISFNLVKLACSIMFIIFLLYINSSLFVL